MSRRNPSSAEKGFTLIEMIIVVTLIGILATLAMPSLRDTPQRTKEAVLKTNLRTLRDTIDQYYGDKGHYPESLEALVDAGYLRALPQDPFTKSSDTWEVEYEEIDPDLEPAETDFGELGQPGIWNVYSGSDMTGLDGTPYSEW